MVSFLKKYYGYGEVPPPPAGSEVLFDFAARGVGEKWSTVTDTVVGGASQAKFGQSRDGHLVFFGIVSLGEGGGFASCQAWPLNLDLSSHAAISLCVRGDGHVYSVNLRDHREDDAVEHCAWFATIANTWSEITLALDDLDAMRHGEDVAGAAPLDRGLVSGLGLSIGDEQAGPFSLEVAWVAAL